MKKPITSNIDIITVEGLVHFCRTASEMELYTAINESKSIIRKNTAKGFFINRFGYQPVCIQLELGI